MGFLDKMMGMGTAGSEAKKEELKAIFQSQVKNSEAYTVLAGMHMVTTKKLFKEIRTFYNYLIGYKDGDDPEIVIISTTSDLSSFEEPVYCKKSACQKAVYLQQTGSFSISHPQLGSEPVDFAIIASTAWGGYVIDVSYVDEYMPFTEFFQTRFAK
jgi:hypothetical protein